MTGTFISLEGVDGSGKSTQAVMLADALQDRVKPDGMAIVMEADHFCMHWRGVKDNESAMVNSVMRGAFLKDPNLRREFLSLLPKHRGN